MVLSFVFDRAHRGLLEEAFTPKEAAASLATATSEKECGTHLQHQADRRWFLAERRTHVPWLSMD